MPVKRDTLRIRNIRKFKKTYPVGTGYNHLEFFHAG